MDIDRYGAVIIDDDDERRDEVRRLVISSGMGVVGACSHGVAATGTVRESGAEVVLVALEEPIVRSLRTVEFLAEALPEVAVVAYSSATSVSVFQRAIRAGARHLLSSPPSARDVEHLMGRLGMAAPESTGCKPGGRVVAVVGQKGGVGKTTISVNLAAALAQEEKASVLVIDFDTAFGDVGISFDVSSSFNVARAAREAATIDADTFKENLVRHQSGASVLGAPLSVGEWLNVQPEQLQTLVEFAEELFDFVVLDTPGTYNEAVAAALSVADHAMIVTSLELTSAKNTALLLRVLEEEGYPEGQVLVIANHTMPEPSFEVKDLADVLARESVWEVPYDDAVRISSQEGRPLAIADPKALAAKSLRALAHRLAVEPDHIDRRAVVRGESRPDSAALRVRLQAALARRPESLAS